MRHRKAGTRLNMTTSHRKAMFRNMVTSLLKYDRIRTTDTRAKQLRQWADHIITLAKRGDLHARRQALSIVREKDVVHKLFEEADKRFGKINGGYTRIVKLGRRPGDAALMSMIELVSAEEKPKKKKKKSKAQAQKAAPETQAATEAKEVGEKAETAEGTGSEQPEEAQEAAAEETADEGQETGDEAKADASAEEAPQADAAPEPDAKAEDKGEESEAPSEASPDEEPEKKED